MKPQVDFVPNPERARELRKEARAILAARKQEGAPIREQWRREANVVAVQMFKDRKKQGLSDYDAAVCVDDLNDFPVPKGIDPCIRGTVFMKSSGWESIGKQLGNREGRTDMRVMNTYILRDP